VTISRQNHTVVFQNWRSRNAMPLEGRLLNLLLQQLPSRFVLPLLVLNIAYPSHTFADGNAYSLTTSEATPTVMPASGEWPMPIVIPASGEWYRAYRSMTIPLSTDMA
jgi:hypothetical protein